MVVEAAEKTETYCTLRVEGTDRDRRTENELAELWSHASVLVMRIDRKLAFRLSEKSRFWRDPVTWSTEQIERAGISLRSVKKDAERLLNVAASLPDAAKNPYGGIWPIQALTIFKRNLQIRASAHLSRLVGGGH